MSGIDNGFRDRQAEQARGSFIGGEPVALTLYYLPDHDDECIGHDCTLEGIATFLASGDPHSEPGQSWHGRQADPNVLQNISRMDCLADRRLIHIDDNKWRIEPPLPAPCNFNAVRWAPDLGWDVDTVSAGSTDCEVFVDQYGSFADYDKDQPIDHVVFAMHWPDNGLCFWYSAKGGKPDLVMFKQPTPDVAGST